MGSSARYDLPGAANFPERVNVTGGEVRDALVIRRGHVLTMDRRLGDIPGRALTGRLRGPLPVGRVPARPPA